MLRACPASLCPYPVFEVFCAQQRFQRQAESAKCPIITGLYVFCLFSFCSAWHKKHWCVVVRHLGHLHQQCSPQHSLYMEDPLLQTTCCREEVMHLLDRYTVPDVTPGICRRFCLSNSDTPRSNAVLSGILATFVHLLRSVLLPGCVLSAMHLNVPDSAGI